LIGVLWLMAAVITLPLPVGAAKMPDDPAVVGWPNAMAATGDSITRAFNTGTIPFTDSPGNSWSTGTNGSVNSHYARILAANPLINGHSNNDAVTGAQMSDLAGQIADVNTQQVGYVTILLGANDACTPTEQAMTPVATFRSQFETALAALSAGSPNTRIYVLSIPDLYNLWSILKDNASARATWSLFSICQSMLANPLSNDPADVARRGRVRQRVIDYNTELASVCATNIHCRFDSNAIFNTVFVPGDVSTRDYFHPSVAGQAKIAANSYAATYDFTDSTPPTTVLAPDIKPAPQGQTVGLLAFDNVGVAGIEYRLDNGAYTRYTGFVIVPWGHTMTYRAVDRNGNIEASHQIKSP
jgi:lysophospholipase L1-like esterase